MHHSKRQRKVRKARARYMAIYARGVAMSAVGGSPRPYRTSSSIWKLHDAGPRAGYRQTHLAIEDVTAKRITVAAKSLELLTIDISDGVAKAGVSIDARQPFGSANQPDGSLYLTQYRNGQTYIARYYCG